MIGRMTIPEFVQKWRGRSGGERQNAVLFLLELTDALGVPRPEPASSDNRDNGYVYERYLRSEEGGGKTRARWIDLYKRGCFVCEVKKIDPSKNPKGFDTAMFAAKEQADRYIRAIPSQEGRPPFLMLVDVGNVIELYSEFSRTGGTYVEFPDPHSYRIRLDDLLVPEIAERLRQVWLDPLALDPAKRRQSHSRNCRYFGAAGEVFGSSGSRPGCSRAVSDALFVHHVFRRRGPAAERKVHRIAGQAGG